MRKVRKKDFVIEYNLAKCHESKYTVSISKQNQIYSIYII